MFSLPSEVGTHWEVRPFHGSLWVHLKGTPMVDPNLLVHHHSTWSDEIGCPFVVLVRICSIPTLRQTFRAILLSFQTPLRSSEIFVQGWLMLAFSWPRWTQRPSTPGICSGWACARSDGIHEETGRVTCRGSSLKLSWDRRWQGARQLVDRYGYGSIPINTIFSGMNIHLPAILMFTRGYRVLTHNHISTTCLETRIFWDRNFTARHGKPSGSSLWIISRESLEKGKGIRRFEATTRYAPWMGYLIVSSNVRVILRFTLKTSDADTRLQRTPRPSISGYRVSPVPGTLISSETIDSINRDLEMCGLVSDESRDHKSSWNQEARRMAALRRFMGFPSPLNFVEYCPGMLTKLALVHASDLGRMPSDLWGVISRHLLLNWYRNCFYGSYNLDMPITGGKTWKLTDTFSIARSHCVGSMILWSMSCNWLNQQQDLWFLWHQATSKPMVYQKCSPVVGQFVEVNDSKAMDPTGMDQEKVGTLISTVFSNNASIPICSMYGIFTNIYPINDPNVGKYTTHGAHGIQNMNKICGNSW